MFYISNSNVILVLATCYVSHSRLDEAPIQGFSSWCTFEPKGLLTQSAYFSLRISHLTTS